MAKLDTYMCSQSSQPSVGGVKEFVLFQIIFRIQPFFPEFSPYRFGNIQMWRIGRKVSDEQSTPLPKRYSFDAAAGFVNTGVIQYQNGFLFNTEKKFFQKFNDRTDINSVLSHHSHILTFPVDKSHHVDFISSLYRYVNLFIRELPAIRHVALRTDMGFIPIKRSISPVSLRCSNSAITSI